jgi:hypothetical protein
MESSSVFLGAKLIEIHEVGKFRPTFYPHREGTALPDPPPASSAASIDEVPRRTEEREMRHSVSPSLTLERC